MATYSKTGASSNSICTSPIFRTYIPLLLLFSLLFLLSKEWITSISTLMIPGPASDSAVPSSNLDEDFPPVDDSAATKLDSEVQYDFPPFVRLYKSGRVQRHFGTVVVPASAFPMQGTISKDVIINEKTGLAARLYMPDFIANGTKITSDHEKLPILMYIHGGAFVIQSAFSPVYQPYLKSLVLKANLVVVSVDYRLAPEHRLPIGYNDSHEALQWVIANAKSGPEKYLSEHGDLTRIYVAGESAGGNIAHNVVMRAGLEGLDGGVRIKGLMLLDPYFWGKEPVGKERREPALRQRMESTWGFVCGEKYGIDHPYVNPLSTSAEQWRKLGCERVLVTVSELDLFRERGVAYVQEGLKKSGWTGMVEMYETMGEDHCYFLSQPDSQKSKKQMDYVISFITRHSN